MNNNSSKEIYHGFCVNQYKKIIVENTLQGEILRTINQERKTFEEIDLIFNEKSHEWKSLEETRRREIYDSIEMIINNYYSILEINKLKELAKKSSNNKNSSDLCWQVLTLLNHKDAESRRKATELIVEHIKEKFYIYTIKSDTNTESFIYLDGIYCPNAQCYLKEICREILKENYTIQFTNEVVAKIQVDTYIETDIFFKQNNVFEIPVANGILNLQTGELGAWNPKKIFFTKIPILYQPDKICPNIIKFMESIVKHEEDVNTIFEMFGYCLLKDYKIQKAFMMLGTGSNGKGRMLELLKRFLGVDNCTAISIQEIEKDSFSIAQLFGKLANISGDISKESLQNTGNFKMLTGGDLISANRKFMNRLSFVNYSKQIFSTNDLPRTYDLSLGFWRRWIILEFPYRFMPKRDYSLLTEKERSEKVGKKSKYQLADENIINNLLTEEELSGLLNITLAKLKVLLEKAEFSNSKTTQEIRNTWIRKSSSFQAFCLDCLQTQWDGEISKEILRQKYNEYCKGHQVVAEGDKVIKEHLTREYGATDDQKLITTYDTDNNGYGSTPTRKMTYVWKGIKLREDIQTLI